MRLVRFGGAMSLDGYIAGPKGEHDWIVMDPEIDFAGITRQFDTFLIGRKTFDAMKGMGNAAKSWKDITNIVFSRTMKPSDAVFPPPGRVTLKLRSQRVYKKTGTLGVEYDILKSSIGSGGSKGSVG